MSDIELFIHALGWALVVMQVWEGRKELLSWKE
jgi:hypothetical protein